MKLNVGNLPIWKGVQGEPGFTALPFTLGISRGLIRLALPQSELDRITEAYSKDSYSFITSPPGTSAWGNRLGDWYFDMLAKQVGHLAGKTVLEVGSGTLYIAERVASELEAAHFIACDPALRSKPGLKTVEVVREYFSWQLFNHQSFDLIISIGTLEHIPDPFEHLVDVRRLLEARNGTLYVVVPDCSRGLRMGDIGICVHEHLSYFTPETLTSILTTCGFVVDWLYTQQDTIFATAQPTSAAFEEDDSSEISTALLKMFDTRLHRNLETARRLIFTHKQNGRLAIHGCHAGLNNLFGLLGIGTDPNIFLFDGDSNKVGKYLPTFDRPIMSSTDDLYKTMQTVIVAALTYYDEIYESIVNDHQIPSSRIYPVMPLDEGHEDH